jgi:hypothetical protein
LPIANQELVALFGVRLTIFSPLAEEKKVRGINEIHPHLASPIEGEGNYTCLAN